MKSTTEMQVTANNQDQRTHWRKKFDYRFLCGDELEKEITLKIREIKDEEVESDKGKKENKPVAYFEGAKKGIVLNKTNCKTLAKLSHSPYMEDWVGMRVTIYAADISAFGQEMKAIRIKPIIPK